MPTNISGMISANWYASCHAMMAPVAKDAATTTGMLVRPTCCICSTVVWKLLNAPGMLLNNIHTKCR